MANEITIISNGQFKSKALNTATAGLYKAFQSMQNGQKDACAILAKVERNKSYKEDGFTSLADYGAAIGLGDKSLIHKMENAGRLLISEDAAVKAFADQTDYSKLTILSSVKPEDLKQAIESGEVKPDMTQDKVKSWKATKAIQDKGDKVLPKFEIDGVYGDGKTFHYDAVEIENVPEIETFTKIGTFDKQVFHEDGTMETSGRWTVYANVYTGEMLRVKADKIKKAKKASVNSEKDLTKDDLIKLAEKLGVKISFGE